MFASRRDTRNSSTSGILLKAKRFGIFSVFAITANIFTIPLAAYSQIAVDGSTATEVKGNVISPTGAGTVNGRNLYNSFQEFNVPTSGVIFNTGSSSVDGNRINNIINRVTGENPSSILGAIESRQAYPNANLYLLNPNGVIFSPNARLDIGGSFNVSTGTGLGFNQNQNFTVDKNSLSFPSGDPKNIQFAIAQPAGIINQGNLSVDAGKNITITAGTVINTGNLTAPNGNVSLAAVSGNSQVELRSPDLVLGLSVSKDAIPSNWNGAIASLPKLAESLTGKAAEANQVVVKPDGSIALVTNPISSDIVVKDGMAIASGKIDVSSAVTKGGNVGIFGNQVGLVNAQIDASGITGGGTVLIGGDFQGKGIAPQAEFTNLDKNSQIQADAISRGDGGRVAIWSTDTTNVEGLISAKGGTQFGNGGFIETSGKKVLSITSIPNASAKNGLAGTWLIDPTNITIIPTGGTLGTNTVGANLINAALNTGTSVIIDTDTASGVAGVGNITQNAGADIIKTSGGDVTLTFNANNDIILNGNITSSLNKLNLNIIGNSDNVGFGRVEINQPLSTLGGNITIRGNANGSITNLINGVVTNASLNSGGGNINITGTSNIQSGVSINNNIDSAGGSITIDSTNTALGTGVGAVISGVITSQNGNINITANKPLNPDEGLFVFGSIDAGTGNLTLTSDGIAFAGGANTIRGTGDFLLQPLNASRSIKLGGISTANVLDIDTVNFGAIQQNFNSITIGRSDSNGAINLSDNITFDSSVTIQSPTGNGTINASGFNLNNTGGSITLLANQNITTRNIGAAGNVIVITSNLGAINTSILNNTGGSITLLANQDITTTFVTTLGNSISIASTSGAINTLNIDTSKFFVAGNAGDITLQSAGNITTSAIFALSSINGNGGNISLSTSGGEVNITDSVGTSSDIAGDSGDITIQSFGNITTGTSLVSSALNGNGGQISLITTNGAIDTSRGSVGSVSFSNGVGGNISYQASGNIKTSNISVQTSTSLNSNISLFSTGGSIDTSLGFLSIFSTLQDNPNVGDISLTALNGNIATGRVSTSSDSGNTGNITLTALNGNITTTSNLITTTSNGITPSSSPNSIAGSVLLNALNISIGGDIAASSSGVSSGDITFNGNLLLSQDIEIFSSSITFGGTINGNHALSLGADTISFNGVVGDTNPLASLFAIGRTFTSTGDLDIRTIGNILVSDNIINSGRNVSLSASGALPSANISVATIDTISSTGVGGNILLQATGNIDAFNLSASGELGGGNIQITSGSNINVTRIDTRTLAFNVLGSGNGGNVNLDAVNGTIDFGGDLPRGLGGLNTDSLFSDPNSNAGSVIFNGLNLVIGGDISLRSFIGKGGNLTLNGDLLLKRDVSIFTNGNIGDGNINFGNTINGNQALSLNAGTNSIFFNGIVGGVTPLASLAIAPTSTLTSINNLDITTVGNITTGNITNLGRDIAITSNLGAIDTKNLDTSNVNANAGSISLQSTNNIKTGLISSIVNNVNANNGNGGQISLITSNGSIDILDRIESGTFGNNGNAGNILISSLNGNIVSRDIFAATSNGNGGLISLIAGGGINTSLGLVGTGAFGTGNSGGIIYQASANITTGSINTFASNGNAGSISLITSGGTVDTSLGSLDSTSNSGNGGNITISATNGNIVTSNNIFARTLSTNPSSSAGSITLDALNLAINGNLSSSAIAGTAKDITLNGNLPLTSNLTFITSSNTGTSGNIDLANASITGNQVLILDAGTGNISFGAIGTSSVPLTAINLASGSITLNKDIYVSDALRFDSPVTLGGNIAITNSAALTFSNTINGNQALSINALNILFNGIVGGVTPLASLTTNATSTIASTGDIDIRTVGDITTGQISDFRRNISLITGGNISTSSITTLAPNGTDNAGNVSLISGGSINNTGLIFAYSAGGNGGNILYQAAGNISVAGNVEANGGGLNGKGGNISFITSSGSIFANSIIQSGGTSNGGNITLQALGNISIFQIDSNSPVKGGDISILTSSGVIEATAPLATYGGNITLQAAGNIKTGGVFSYGLTNINGGEISLTSSGGSIDTILGGVNSSSPSGNAGNISINAPFGSILTSDIGAYTFSANPNSTAGNISLNALNLSVGNNVSSSATAGKAGNLAFSSNIALTGSTVFSSTSSGGISGNIDLFNANITGSQALTLNAGTGNISLAEIGTSSVPLTTLNVTSGSTTLNKDIFTSGAMQFDSPVTLGGNVSLSSSASSIAFNDTVNGNQALSLNAGTNSIFFNGIVGNVSPLASLAIAPTSTLTSINNLEVNTVGNITTGNITNEGRNIAITSSLGAIDSSLGIVSTGVGNGTGGSITVTAATIKTGAVNSSSVNGNGGDIDFNASGSIDTSLGTVQSNARGSSNTGTGGKISYTSSNGNITTGTIASSSTQNSGDGGNIDLSASGDITTGSIESFSFNANGGLISLITTNGAINTSLGVVQSSAFGTTANGGNISYQATGNITTGDIFSSTNGDNGGLISLITTNGVIDTSLGIVRSSGISGNGGNISYQATGNITTGSISSFSFNANGGLISLITTNGAIDTSLGVVESSGFGFGGSGNSGNIIYQAFGNIATGNISSDSFGNDNAGEIILTSVNGSINTAEVIATIRGGNGGNITFNSQNGNFSNSNGINASTNSTNASSTAGSLAINALNITNIGNINLSANAGTAGDINLRGNLPLTASTTFSTNSGGISGNINLGNATVTGNQSFTLNAGNGNVAIGAIGTSLLPLTDLTVTSGNTTLKNDIFTINTLTFNSPVNLLGNVAIKTANGAIAFNNTVNGNQSLSLNAGTSSIFFNGMVGNISPLASLAIAPTSTLASFNNLDIRTVGNITTGNVSNLGRNIAIISNNGNIDTSAGAIDTSNSTGNGGDVLLQSLGNITVSRIRTESLSGGSGGDISLISLGGSINTSAGPTKGFLNSRSNNGIGGDILLQAAGNITTADLSTSSGQGSGKISLITSNGSIDTSLGLVQTEIGLGNGNGGEILYRATGNITTGEVLSRIQSSPSTGSGGKISFITTGGSINNQGAVYSLSFGPNGGDILYEATGDIKTSSAGVISSGNINGGNITFKTTGGAIDTSLSQVTSSGNNGGTAGNILFQATGNITIQNLLASGISGNGGNVTLQTTGNVAIAGNVDTGATNGNAGNIAISATGLASDINVGFLNSRSFGTNGNGGNISLTATGNIKSSSDISSGSFNGNGGNISLITTGGSIDISSGNLDSRSQNGNGGKSGDINLQSAKDITTKDVLSFAPLGTGNAGKISFNTSGGNITSNTLFSYSANAKGGDIDLQATGNITISQISAFSNSPSVGDVLLFLKSTGGSIQTGNIDNNSVFSTGAGGIRVEALGNISANDVSTSTTNGTSGAISFTATNGDITTNFISTRSDNGVSGNVFLTATNGSVNALNSGIDATSINGSGGNIAIAAPNGTINTPFLFSFTTSADPNSKAGLVTLNTNNLALGGGINASGGKGIDVSAANGKGSNFDFSGNLLLLSDVTISTAGLAGSGNINLANANITGNQTLILNAGTGNVDLGTIGTNTIAILGLSLTSGNTILSKDIFVNGSLDFKNPVTLTNDVTVNSSNIIFRDAINGSQSLLLNAGTGNIIFNGTVGTTTALGNIIANSGGITRFNSNVNAASLTTDEIGTTQINGNILTSGAQTFNDAVNLTNPVQLTTTNSAIAFNNSVNGTQNLTLNSGSADINFNGAVGNSTPLANLLINSAGLVRFANSVNAESLTISAATLSANGSITTTGNIDTRNINNSSSPLFLTSNNGSITTGNISTTPLSPINGGNVTLDANKDVNTGNIATDSLSSTGGNVLLRSRSGQIVTGNVNTTGIIGGSVFFDAAIAIAAGAINSSGTTRAGDVTLDPLGDVVVSSIDASSPLQAGNVSLVSTGGGLRIMDLINNSSSSACIGSSICTSGAIAGNISLQTGGVSSFIVGDSSINGSAGTLTTGSTTIQLGTTILVRLGSQFIQGNATTGKISISPGFILAQTSTSTNENSKFIPPTVSEGIITIDPDESKLLAITEVLKEKVDGYFKEGNLESAFETIEDAYTSELDVFTGKSTKAERSRITIENTQDMLSTVVQQTGDAAVLIYPVLLKDRIEILVIPPSEKGNAFRATSTTLNQESAQAIISEYRNNLRDVGSNDYLEQSQKLYDWIIRPVEKKLEELKIDTLVFVMDSGLRVSPPAALHDGKKFLIERYAIASIPTLRALRLEQRDRKTTRVLAMGLTESVEGFSALPSVDIEIKTISSEVLNGAAFLNQDFTVNNLQKQRQGGAFNILHLGTHAKFVSDTSKDSFIQFWDSRLKLSEIPQLRFDSPAIDMLALSACQTAVGNNLGISGLAVESGAKSVLASLWEVSDAGTAPLMISFYKAFPDAVNKAQAMRTAQLALLGGKVKIGNGQILGIEGFPNIPLPSGLSDIDLSHPFYWSSFILVGNWL